ncbi:dihydrofolate reductase [Egibacter rhizosphaerae]|uniref:Dihydrofolate reductase n=1 Tax=Egibacter rhizosphaerae TaxID=1670831 RepID=A0A411YFC9_9ACTN|nr:dihydrofolate reductase family protein [Egibacter rhizosphaerae]QBI19881.1 dihydrofolate reductase [Egibacter rhizosphaerae]
MGNVRVSNFSVSLDGYAAGPDQSMDAPLGIGGEQLHEWAFATRSFREPLGMEGGVRGGVDDDLVAKGNGGVGATIIGRNMFGPIRGPWGDSDWRGWWGAAPPFGHSAFVLTHHPRDPIEMEGGTTFHFVTEGIEVVLKRAQDAAGDADVRIGGGPATVRQFLDAGLVDEVHLAVTPILLGAGERLFTDAENLASGYTCTGQTPSDAVTHYHLHRAG